MRAVHRASRATGHSAFPAARWGRRGKRGVVRSAEAGVPAGQLARVAHPIGRRHAREAATSRRRRVDARRDDVPRPGPPASVAYFGIGAHQSPRGLASTRVSPRADTFAREGATSYATMGSRAARSSLVRYRARADMPRRGRQPRVKDRGPKGELKRQHDEISWNTNRRGLTKCEKG